jgi:tripeptidyl-peptidase-1
MLISLVLFGSVVLGSSLASPATLYSNYAVKEKHHVPQGWNRIRDAAPDTLIALRIALRQNNFDELERKLLDSK